MVLYFLLRRAYGIGKRIGNVGRAAVYGIGKIGSAAYMGSRCNTYGSIVKTIACRKVVSVANVFYIARKVPFTIPGV